MKRWRGFRTVVPAVLMVMTAVSALAADTVLTVYNDDLGVVRVTDDMAFEKGVQTVTYTDVAALIDPTSVRLAPRDPGVVVLEQNFSYDLVNQMTLLSRYIDRNVTIHLRDGDIAEGVLQSAMGDVILGKPDGGVEILSPDVIERYALPELPGGLVTRPTLIWTISSPGKMTAPAEISYMTRGLSWHAEYTAVVDKSEKAMEVSSWVSIENNSGAAYTDARLKLVAGDVNRVRPPQPVMRSQMVKTFAEADDGMGFAERGLFEYHLYDLGRKTTIARSEIKQISLFEPALVACEKKFVYDASQNATRVIVGMEFVNTEKNGIGMALPAGKVRVYTRDSDGSLEFVGEDALEHTPRDETVRLTLGAAFDIAAERTVTDTRRISDRVMEQSVAISLRNRKSEAATITVVEHLRGDWELVQTSEKFVKKDATTAECTITIPAGNEREITYTVRLR